MKKISLLLTSIGILTACGGGGDGGGTAATATTSSVTYPLDSAVTAFFNSSHSFTSSYTDPSTKDVYTLTYGYAPGGDSAFEGKAAKTATLTINVKKNGTQVATSSGTVYFQIGPFKRLGAILGTGEYSVVTNQAVLPASAKAGDIGNLDTATEYTSSNKIQISSTSVDTWELQADTANTAYFCINSTSKSPDGSASSSAECYKINASGAVIGNKFTLVENGKSITFVN